MDSYVLKIDDIRGSQEISITENRYLTLCHSVKEIDMCTQIEEKLDGSSGFRVGKLALMA